MRVLDLTRVLSGPYCTRLLCDLGAEVIKLEPPDADMSRGIGERRHGLSAYFLDRHQEKAQPLSEPCYTSARRR